MTLTFDTADSAIFGQLKTAWDANTPALMVSPTAPAGYIPATVYEATESDLKPHPRDGSLAWARAVMRHADAEKVTLVGASGARYRRHGCIWVQVFTPAVDATALLLGKRLAMVAQTAFEGKRTAGDGVLFTKATIKESPKDGPWFLHNVVAYFYWDERR